MHPPSWALAGSRRLDLDEFGAAFAGAWSRIDSRFLKLECWQSYREADTNESQAAYNRGDVGTARRLLEHEAESDRRFYDDVRSQGIEYARVRLLQEPLTPYLKYELLSYRIRVEMGENIEIVRCDPTLHLPDERHFDFLLFDRHTALIHNYGTTGVGFQVGGWLTNEREIIARLDATVAELRSRALPLRQYLAQIQP